MEGKEKNRKVFANETKKEEKEKLVCRNENNNKSYRFFQYLGIFHRDE